MSENQGLEAQLFDWHDWDQQSTMAFTFYDVEMKVGLGTYPVGQKFGCVCLDYEKSTLAVWKEGNETGTPDNVYSLSISAA